MAVSVPCSNEPRRKLIQVSFADRNCAKRAQAGDNRGILTRDISALRTSRSSWPSRNVDVVLDREGKSEERQGAIRWHTSDQVVEWRPMDPNCIVPTLGDSPVDFPW